MARKFRECLECIHLKVEENEEPCSECGGGEYFEEKFEDTVDYLEENHYE